MHIEFAINTKQETEINNTGITVFIDQKIFNQK